MKKLTEKQKKIVEDNHNLIYGFIHSKELDVDEFYGLVAESLCKSVIAWEEDRGKLSTLFYKVASMDLYKYWKRQNAQKRTHSGLTELEEDFNAPSNYNLEDSIVLKETVEELKNSEYWDLIELTMQGYTQKEIAEIYGVAQPTVNRWLKLMKEEYFD